MLMRSILFGILALIAAGFAFLSYDWYRGRDSAQSFGSPFTLVDQTDQPITEAAFRGHPTLLFFGFTHCPEVCPTTLPEMDSWLKDLGDEGKTMRAYFVSIDPERDTPDVMNTYVGNVSKRVVGITGDPAKVLAMAKSYGIYFRKVPDDDGGYTMDHTASVLLLNRNGGLEGTIAYGEDRKAAMAKLKRLAEEG